jgi:DNA polymerase elongation subunit (family B)
VSTIKILCLDIETAPHIVMTFELWKANIPADHIIEPSRMICWAAKWVGGDRIFFKSEFHNTREDMVMALWELLNEADAVLHYNGQAFDMPKINTAFALYDLEPPSPYKQIDLYQTARRVFSFASNKLDYLTKTLGVGAKVKHEGFDLWVKCMDSDPAAWKKMRKYNKGDVKITEALYWYLLPWIPGLPNNGAMSGTDVCPTPNCTGGSLIREGYSYTISGKYQRYHCSKCGRWSRASRRIAGTGIVPVSLAG